MWRSLVSRMVRVHEAAGSNPATPTTQKACSSSNYRLFCAISVGCFPLRFPLCFYLTFYDHLRKLTGEMQLIDIELNPFFRIITEFHM